MKNLAVAAVTLLPFAFGACASTPAEPTPPCIELAELHSTRITPEAIEFRARVVVRNGTLDELRLRQVDYGADLHDRRLFDETFADLKPMRAGSTTTVTLPFQVAMKDVAAQVEDVLAEESVRVTLRGAVVPIGHEPLPFHATKVLPLPKPPRVTLAGARGNPMDGEFTVFLQVDNPNTFPLSFGSAETWLKIDGRRHDLLRTESFTDLPAGGSGRVALTMRMSRAKGIGMIVGAVKNRSADYAIGGQLACRTPHGLFCLPVELSSTPAAPGR
ncbi:MAG: hypothetical protein KF830_02380 [Planctomycetes bacterium]|nr:hypothetical protein [Planctomycetota bacterium]